MKKLFSLRSIFTGIFVFSIIALMPTNGFTDTRTWNSGGGDSNWMTSGNWGGTAPNAGDTLQFGSGAKTEPNNNFDAGTSFGGIVFLDSSNKTFNLCGNAITLTGNILDQDDYGQGIKLDITLGADVTFETQSGTLYLYDSAAAHTIDNAGHLLTVKCNGFAGDIHFINTPITGSGGLTKTGSKAVYLEDTNTYTGTTTVSEGTLIAAGNAAALGAGALTMSGGKLQLADNTGLNFGRNTTVSSSSEINSYRLSGAGAGSTNTLGTLSINGSILTVRLGDALTTSGTQGLTFGDVTLTGNATITTASTAGAAATGLLTLGAVTGAGRNFTITGTEATTITGGVNTNGSGSTGGAVSVTQDGAININSTISTRGGNVLTNWDPATGYAGGAITINSTAAAATIVGDINTNGGNGQSTTNTGTGGAAGAVTINAATTAVVGNITTQGGTGQSTSGTGAGGSAGTVDITAGTSITLNGYIYALTGPGYSTGGPTAQGNGANVHLHGATILGTDITINTTGATAGEILFADTLNGTTDFADDLSLTAGNGNVTFTGAVGATKELGAITISSANVLEASSLFIAKSLTQVAGTGSSHFDGEVNTTGAVDTAGGAVSITTSGEVHFANAIIANGGFLSVAGAGKNAGSVFLRSTAANLEVDSGISAVGSDAGIAGAGGAGGPVTVSAATTAAVGDISTDGGAGAAADNNGGEAGAVDITAGTSITLNGNISAVGGASGGGAGVQGAGGNVHLHGSTILGGNRLINTGATAGDILFADILNATVDFVESLGLTAGTGNITFSGIVGGVNKLGDVTLNSVAAVEASAAFTAKSLTQVAGTGSSHFDGAVTTTGAADTAGGVVSIDTAGEIHFASSITSDAGTSGAGDGKDAGAIHLDSSATNVEVNGAISAVGSAAGTGAGGAGGAVTIYTATTSAVSAINTTGGDGTGANAGGAAGTIGITGAGTTLGGDITARGGATATGTGGAGGDVTLASPVTLGVNLTIDTRGGIPTGVGTIGAGGDIDFKDTLNGAYTLNINAAGDAATGGSISFDDVVGGTTALGAVTITDANDVTASDTFSSASLVQVAGSGTTTLMGDVTTTTATGVDITNNAIILDGLTMDTSTGNGVVRFNAPVTLSTGAVGITGGMGAIDFTGTVDTGGQILTITNAATGVATISGAVSGTGGLVKSGAGALHLDGNNTYAGGTTINAGTLNVGHANAVGTGPLTNNATLNLGAISLTLGDAYTQNAGAILAITVNSASNFGSIISTVAAVVDSASTIAVTVGGSIPRGTTLKIIDTLEKGIGAVPGTITSTDPSVIFKASIFNNDLILTVFGNHILSSVGATLNPNAATVGAVVDNIPNPSADMTTVINALNTLSNSQAASSLNSMTPTVDGALLQSAISMLHQITGSTENHLANMRTGGPTGISTGDSYLHGLDIWAQGLGDYAHQDPRGFSNGYNATSWGVSGGADIPLNIGNDTLRMGLGCGYGQTLVRSKDSSGRNDIDSIPGTLYCSYENDKYPFYLDTAFTFIYNTYNTSRAVTVGTLTQRTASADYNGQQYSAYLEGGYSFFYKKLRITPLASFQYMHLHTASYTETGAGALNLSVNSQDYDMAMTGLGTKVACPFESKYGTITPDLHVKWLYDWVGDNQATTAAFAGGGSAFPTSGFRTARSAYDMGTKVSIKTKYDISFDLDYDFLLKSQYYEHYGSVAVKYSF